MSNLDKDTKNILLGALIGGVVGMGAISILCAVRSDKKDENSPLELLGKAIGQVGEIVQSRKINEAESFVRETDKKIHGHESRIAEVLEWTAAGIELWKKLKKGA